MTAVGPALGAGGVLPPPLHSMRAIHEPRPPSRGDRDGRRTPSSFVRPAQRIRHRRPGIDGIRNLPPIHDMTVMSRRQDRSSPSRGTLVSRRALRVHEGPRPRAGRKGLSTAQSAGRPSGCHPAEGTGPAPACAGRRLQGTQPPRASPLGSRLRGEDGCRARDRRAASSWPSACAGDDGSRTWIKSSRHPCQPSSPDEDTPPLRRRSAATPRQGERHDDGYLPDAARHDP